ncbi:MAG TPA: flagellar basal-body MS-ring/collar protein FliF [Planctomycetota bacterium]|nr:flagellar basal-body MS-ring/collar protein FliF [Planctomycetota bacterium]
MADLFTSFASTWRGLTTSQRAGVVFALLGGLAFVAAITWYGNRPEWRPLVRSAEPGDVAEVVSALEQAGVPVRASADGSSLSVPADRYSDATLALSKKGLPKQGVGLEIFDATTLSWTSFLEQTNLRRGTQGEIERVLKTWKGIASARVLIASEKEGLWSRPEREGTAAVSVTMRPGSKLPPSMVAAIQSFVASSWPTLTPERVSVVADGQQLTRDPGGDEGKKDFALANEQLVAQIEYEDRLRRKAQEAIDTAEGPGKAVVTVHAELDFDSREEESRTFEEQDRKVEEKTNDTSKPAGEAAAVSGQPGVASNLPPGDAPRPAVAPAPAEAGKETSSLNETKYEPGRALSTKRTKKNGYAVKRISVALLADKALAPRLEALTKIVQSAVGFDAKRGDAVEKSADAEFPKPVEAPATPQPEPSSFFGPDTIATGARTAALLGLVALFFAMVRRAKKKGATVEIAPRPPAAGAPAGTPDVAIGAPRPPAPTISKIAGSAALADPAAAGKVLRSWIEAKTPR